MSVNDLFAREGSFQKWDQSSSYDRKAEAEKAREANRVRVYRHVDKRDGNRCRVCRRLVEPFALSKTHRGHHHHLTFRSKGGDDRTENLILICAAEHDLIHVKRTLRVEGNADEAITVWSLDTESGEWFVLIQEEAVGIRHRD